MLPKPIGGSLDQKCIKRFLKDGRSFGTGGDGGDTRKELGGGSKITLWGQ